MPSKKLESIDQLPHFSIIESNLNDLRPKKRTRQRKSPIKDNTLFQSVFSSGKQDHSRLTKYDPTRATNMELYQHINDI